MDFAERLFDHPARPIATLVLAHGAGAAMDHSSMTELARALYAADIAVVRFEFPYMAARRSTGVRRPPDRMPVLESTYRALVTTLDTDTPLFIGGRSMGGRVATHVADALGVRGVVAYGYPFHPPRKPASLRVAHLTTLRTPCLIVQGTRDPFGSPVEVADYPLGHVRVHWLAAGDHTFTPLLASGRKRSDLLAEAAACTRAFIERTLAGQAKT